MLTPHSSGELKKCPACGWRLDAEAYRCPKCFIYFCYRCRARVAKGESQYQCADQSCECYGKLLCAACTVMVDHPATDYGEDLLLSGLVGTVIASIATGIAIYSYSWKWWLLIPAAVAGFFLGAYYLPISRQYSYTSQRRCCIRCRQAVKNL